MYVLWFRTGWEEEGGGVSCRFVVYEVIKGVKYTLYTLHSKNILRNNFVFNMCDVYYPNYYKLRTYHFWTLNALRRCNCAVVVVVGPGETMTTYRVVAALCLSPRLGCVSLLFSGGQHTHTHADTKERPLRPPPNLTIYNNSLLTNNGVGRRKCNI